MRIIYSLIFLIIFILGAFTGIKTFVRSKAIFWGTERGIIPIIVNAALVGLSVSFMLFGGVYFLASIADRSYPLEISMLIKSFAFFLIPGFMGFLVALWRYFLVSLGRDQLIKTIISRQVDKNQK